MCTNMLSFTVFASNTAVCSCALTESFRLHQFLSKPFRIRTSRTPIFQPLQNQQLQTGCVSADSKQLITPVESALTQSFLSMSFRINTYKERGRGIALVALEGSLPACL